MSLETVRDLILSREEDSLREDLMGMDIDDIIHKYNVYEEFANLVNEWVIDNHPESYRDAPEDEFMDEFDKNGIYDSVKESLIDIIIEREI